jgi:hypothetical protein
MQSTRYSCSLEIKLQFSRHAIEKYSDIKFHKNVLSGSRIVPWGQLDRHDEASNRFSQFCERAKNNRNRIQNTQDSAQVTQNDSGLSFNVIFAQRPETEGTMEGISVRLHISPPKPFSPYEWQMEPDVTYGHIRRAVLSSQSNSWDVV